MNAALPNTTDTVTLNYGEEYVVDYIFKDGEDAITRRSKFGAGFSSTVGDKKM